MFPACAITCAMSKKVAGSKSSVEISNATMLDLSEAFIGDPDFAKPLEFENLL